MLLEVLFGWCWLLVCVCGASPLYPGDLVVLWERVWKYSPGDTLKAQYKVEAGLVPLLESTERF